MNLYVLAALGVRQGVDVMHDIRGQDDEAARRWEEFQRRSLSEKRAEVQ